MSWSNEPLIVEPVDLKALENSIADALLAPNIHIFLDTNILIWLFKPHAAARDAFLEWLEQPSQRDRVHIPVRVVHEFSRYRGNHAVLLGGNPTENLIKQVNHFAELASLIVGDAQAKSANFADRTAYLAELGKIQDITRRISKPLARNKDLPELEALLVPKFNKFSMGGNVFKDITRLQKEYEARAEIRMPPGFADLKKAKKNGERDEEESSPTTAGSNRFGDFIIWEEILEFCSTKPYVKGIILLSHDQKKDWCYRPQKIKDLDGHEKPSDKLEYKLTVAHPMLALEARFRAGVDQLFAVTIPQFARLGVRHGFIPYLGELARAVQVEASEAKQEETNAEAASEVEIGLISSPEHTPTSSSAATTSGSTSFSTTVSSAPPIAAISNFLSNVPNEAIADENYVADPSGSTEMDDAIRGLKTINWYAQNPAATHGIALIRNNKCSSLQGFIFGRNLYQAACGSAIVPERILDDLPRELAGSPAHLSEAVYAGVLCEAYIDKSGRVRNRPKSALIANIFRHQSEPKFKRSVLWLRETLRSVSTKFALLPNPVAIFREFAVSSILPGKISGISTGGVELTEKYVESSKAAPLPPKISRSWLIKQLAAYYAIPAEQIILRPSEDFVYENEVLALKEWGPHTPLDFPDP